jgi:hypothetical protein
MGNNRIEYIIRIGPFDQYRHLHIKERGKIVFFRVQYETKINQIWYPVVRYNTAHGFAHRDLLNFKERGRNNFLNYASQLQATFARSQITKISK